MTALDGAVAMVACTTPSPLGEPCAFQTETPVCWRPPHWVTTGVHVNPIPETAVTATLDFEAIAAR